MSRMNKLVEIYTDGACSGNPGPGGWAALLIYKDTVREISGGQTNTTNNRMELTAAIEALHALKEPCRVKLYSDSSYLVNAFNNHWLDKWKQTGRLISGKKAVKNPDLWLSLSECAQIHQIEWIKVKGHSDNILNERCDFLAVAEAERAAENNEDLLQS